MMIQDPPGFILLVSALDSSRSIGRIVDCPAAVRDRYGGVAPRPRHSVWCQAPVERLLAGSTLLVCPHQPSIVHWGVDGWQRTADCRTVSTGLGLHVAELATAELEPGRRADFTWREQSGRWVGHVTVPAALRPARSPPFFEEHRAATCVAGVHDQSTAVLSKRYLGIVQHLPSHVEAASRHGESNQKGERWRDTIRHGT